MLILKLFNVSVFWIVVCDGLPYALPIFCHCSICLVSCQCSVTAAFRSSWMSTGYSRQHVCLTEPLRPYATRHTREANTVNQCASVTNLSAQVSYNNRIPPVARTYHCTVWKAVVIWATGQLGFCASRTRSCVAFRCGRFGDTSPDSLGCAPDTASRSTCGGALAPSPSRCAVSWQHKHRYTSTSYADWDTSHRTDCPVQNADIWDQGFMPDQVIASHTCFGGC